MANGGLGRGIQVGVRNSPQLPQGAGYAPEQMVEGPNVGPLIDDVLKGTYQQRDKETMGIYQDWGELRNYAQAMWKNFNIDVMTPDYSKPESVMASRAFMQKLASLKDKANAHKRGATFENIQAQAVLDPNNTVTRQENELATSDQIQNRGYSDEMRQRQQETYREYDRENMPKVQKNLEESIANQEAILENTRQSGTPNQVAGEEARLKALKAMSVKKKIKDPRTDPNAIKNLEIGTRWYEIEALGRGQFTSDNPTGVGFDHNVLARFTDTSGMPRFRTSFSNPYTGKIYGVHADGDKQVAYDLRGEQGIYGLNSAINKESGNNVKVPELNGYGKANYQELPTGSKFGMATPPKEYYDAEAKVMSDLRNPEKAQDALQRIGAINEYNEPQMRIPIGWEIQQGTGDNDRVTADENQIISDWNVVQGSKGKPSYIELVITDRNSAPVDGVNTQKPQKIRLRNGIDDAKLKELIGYNFGQGAINFNAQEYGYTDEDRITYERKIENDPARSTVITRPGAPTWPK